MATVDASIPLGVKPFQVEQPVNQLAKLMQVQGMQQQNQLGQMQMDEYRRGVEETNALRGILGSQGFSWDDAAQRSRAFAAAPTKAESLYKTHVENTSKLSEAEKRRFEMAKEGYTLYQKEAGALFNDPTVTKDKVVSRLSALKLAGVLRPEVADNMAATLPDDPAQLRAVLRNAVTSQLTGEQMLTVFAPKPKQIDNGQQISFVDENPNSPTYGQSTGPAPVQKVATPDAILSSDTSTANNKRSVGASLANAAATREVAQATRDAANIQTGFKNEQDMRKEFEGLPEVKNYKQAYPAYAAIKDAASRNTTQSDINIVYGLAKLYDPTSVVREGEYATVANSPNIPERVKGYAQYLQGGGKLSPETKRAILAEAQGRIGTYEAEVRKARGSYEGIVKQRGMNPGSVFPNMGDMTDGAPPVTGARGGTSRESGGKVQNGPTVFDQADAILNGGKGGKR